MCDAALARTADDVARIVAALGVPVALKIVSPQVLHKTDVGGVALGLDSAEDARAAAAAMLSRVMTALPDAAIEGILVQRMAPPHGVELLLGGVRDPQFGPVVTVGIGGIFVELLADTATRLAPVGRREARRMLDDLRLAPILSGARGRPRVDIGAVADAIVRVSTLMAALPTLVEFELNPLVALPEGVIGVDARGVVQ